MIDDAVRQKYSLTLEEQVFYEVGISLDEHDAIVQVWREKVRHDLVRPTTVIQRWGNDTLHTFTGDVSGGVGLINARDVQPFIRVMPHSEYPSGSACLCTAYQEYTDAFIKHDYGAAALSVSTKGRYVEKPRSWANLIDFKSDCGQSRLWGGMHFTKSVPEGERLCRGIGERSLDFMQNLKNGSLMFGKPPSMVPLCAQAAPEAETMGASCTPSQSIHFLVWMSSFLCLVFGQGQTCGKCN